MAHPNQHDEGRPADITVGLARQAALAEAYPMPEKQAYELFDEYGGHCSPLLPVQISIDRFTFVDLVALRRSKRPLMLPLYRTVDAVDLAGLDAPTRAALLAEAPLLDRWEAPPELRDGTTAPAETRVPLGVLLARRAIDLDGEEVPLATENLRQLLFTGRTGVRSGEGETARQFVVVAEASGQAPGASEHLTLRVSDLAAFLATPRLPSGQSLSLTENQATALAAGEKVVLTPDGGAPITVVRAGTPDLVTGAARAGSLAIDLSTSRTPPERPLPGGYEFVLRCPHRQVWTLLGYTRGGLLNSIPLAPQEETTIEIFSWDRRRTETETTTTDESEISTLGRQTIKDADQVVREAQRQRNWNANGKGEIGVKFGIVNLGGQAGGTIGKQLTDSARRTSDDVVEATDEATQRVKAVRQTRVTESAEFGSETRVTRTVRNLNMTRTLTFDYFETLASYRVETRLSKGDVRLCVLVDDVLPGGINRYFVLHNEGALRAALTSESYRAGFDAVRLLAEFEATCEVACAPGCACEEPVCLCEPAASPTGPGTGPSEPGTEPTTGTTRVCIPVPLPILPGHSLEICREGAGPLSVRLSGPFASGPLTGEGEGPCLRFPVPLPVPPVVGFADVCLSPAGQVSVRAGTAVWLPFAGFTELFSAQIWSGQLGGGTGTATGTGAGGVSGGISVGTTTGGCAGCSGPLPAAVTEVLSRFAQTVLQLEVATRETLAYSPPDAAAQEQWIRTLHTYLYRTLALETACPAFWQRIRAWAHAYRPAAPELGVLKQALHEQRDRVVTMAMLPHAMLGEYARLIRDTARVVGFPRSDFVVRDAGFLDLGFESSLAEVRAVLAAVIARPCPEENPSTTTGTGTPVAGAALGSGNWSLEELAKRLLNPILWTVEKLYEGFTTDEAPPDLSFIEEGGVGAALTAAAIRIARDGPLPTKIRGFDVQRIAEAVVLEQQLLGHISANESHYRQAIWNAMSATDRFNLLTARGDRLAEYADNEVIGFVGRKAVLPFRMEADPDVARWMVEQVLFAEDFEPPAATRIETVPTKGISVQARLGPCDTGESFVMDLREAEVRSRRADASRAEHRAAQAEQEARRRKLRLDRNPPNLSDPVRRQGAVRLSVRKKGRRTPRREN